MARRRVIRSRSGKERVVYAPSDPERRKLRAMLPQLNGGQLAACPDAHGFVPGRSVVTATKMHAGFNYTLTCDLTDFFASVTLEQAAEALSAGGLAHLALPLDLDWHDGRLLGVLVEGHPVQGLPTSPAVANLAARHLDAAIRERVEALGLAPEDYAYTRYADDLTVSYGRGGERLPPERHAAVLAAVTGAVESMGWSLSTRKTKLQWAGAGRRVVCGVAIDPNGTLHPTRRARRNLRAAEHHDPNSNGARGLAEWCRLRLPRAARGCPLLATVRVRCGGTIHRVSLDPTGELICHDHDPDEIMAEVAAVELDAPAGNARVESFGCRCAEVVYRWRHPQTRHVSSRTRRRKYNPDGPQRLPRGLYTAGRKFLLAGKGE